MTSPWDIVEESPYFKNWFTGEDESSPDTELSKDSSLINLRITSKKLIKNSFTAFLTLLAYLTTIVGGKIKIKIITEDEKLKEQCKNLLTNNDKLDICRELNITQIIEQIIAGSFEDGDILINLPIDKRYTGDVKTYVELISASRIKTPPKHERNPLVREGVEYYNSGRLKGYWVITAKNQDKKITYFNAKDSDFEFYPVYISDDNITRKVCYLFKAPTKIIARQSRQVPVLTGLMGLLRYFDQFLEAVLVGTRVAACFAAFVTTKNKANAIKSLSESAQHPAVETKGKKHTKLQPGLITYLNPEEEITFGTPNRPSDNFDVFVLRICRFLAATVRMPYEHLFLDLSVTSYSSWRGGSLEIERNVNRWRRDLEGVIQWILMTLLREGVAKRIIKGSLKKISLSIAFPKFKSIDEEKTARSRKINMSIEATSQQREQDGIGEDYEQLQEELTEEAIHKVEREAKVLVRKKELEEEFDIVFSSTLEEQKRDTSDSRRPGEEEDEDLDEEDAKERRKEDGNW